MVRGVGCVGGVCMCLARDGVGGERIGFGLYQFCGTFGLGRCWQVGWVGVGGWLGPGSVRLGWCYVCV